MHRDDRFLNHEEASIFSQVHSVSQPVAEEPPSVERPRESRPSVQPSPGFWAGCWNSSLLWGALITFGFYALLLSGFFRSDFMMRYFAGSKIEYVEVGLFFVGMAALWIKWKGLGWQKTWMLRRLKGPFRKYLDVADGRFTFHEAGILLEKLRSLPARARSGYFVARLENTLDFVCRNRSAIGVEDEMKYLSDMDADRMTQSYSLIRLVIWAIPILGFLGTVMGITLAIGALGGNLSDTAATLPQMIAGLSVAFDTTAIALAFSIVLMFTQFWVEKSENRHLCEVDFQVHRELSGRFDAIPNTMEGAVLAIRRVGEVVLEGIQQQTTSQVSIWEDSFRRVEMEWTHRLEKLGSAISGALEQALSHGGEELGKQFSLKLSAVTGNAGVEIGTVVAEKLQQQLSDNLEKQLASQIATIREMQRMMAEQSSMMHEAVRRHVENTAKNVEVISKCSEIFYHTGSQMENTTTALAKATEMTGRVAEMENILAHNLSTLQGAKNFERTVADLSDATKVLAQWLDEVRSVRRAA